MSAPLGVVIGGCPIRLWGLTGEERARRTLLQAGAASVAPEAGDAPAVLAMRADWVVDPALMGLLKVQPGTVLVSRGVPVALHGTGAQAAALAEGVVPEGMNVLTHDGGTLHHPVLRKRFTPALLPLGRENVVQAERATFGSSYKGVTDVVTKYLWPFPARLATRWCAARGITPNMVTSVSLLLVLVAMWAFWQGWFLTGLAAAWAMTFLDTVDGKLARVTLSSTRFGDIFDHAIDLIHPPFWWWAWHMGCLKAGVPYPGPDLALLVTVAGYVVLRVNEGLFVAVFRMQIHVWRRFDSLFRLVVARRNPNLILLTVAAILGQPGWGMVAVAVWTALSVLVQLVQSTQAVTARRSGPLTSWLAR